MVLHFKDLICGDCMSEMAEGNALEIYTKGGCGMNDEGFKHLVIDPLFKMNDGYQNYSSDF
jgi:hypothetical protein